MLNRKKHLICLFVAAICGSIAFAQNEPIGDKSYYEVKGNVKQISYEYYDLQFNKNGQSLCAGFTSTQKKGNNVVYIVPNDMVGDVSTTYDNKGRLVAHSGFEIELADLKYDSLDRLVYFERLADAEMTSVKIDYDTLGYRSKEFIKRYEVSNEGGTEKVKDKSGNAYGLADTITYTYSILKLDSMGNWVKRKRNDGVIETRQIFYY